MEFLREEVMRIERVTFTYLGADEPALRGCSFTLHRGDIVYIAGANGSGKTTLCKLLAGVMQPHEGIAAREGGATGGPAACSGRLGLAGCRFAAYRRHGGGRVGLRPGKYGCACR